MVRLVIALALLAPLAASAQFSNPPIGPGSIIGIGPSSGSGGAAPSGCTPTGLDFTLACNSQYITVIQ